MVIRYAVTADPPSLIGGDQLTTDRSPGASGVKVTSRGTEGTIGGICTAVAMLSG